MLSQVAQTESELCRFLQCQLLGNLNFPLLFIAIALSPARARFFRKVLEKLDDATIPRDSFLHFVWRRRFWKKEQKTLR